MTPTHPTQASVGAHLLLDWLKEREANARRIAAGKTGEDRAGWLEDAMLFEAAAAAVWHHAEAITALQGLLDALPSATTHPAIKRARAAIARATPSPTRPAIMTDVKYPREMDIIAIAYKWAKTAGFFDFERNDFIACVKEISDATCALRGAQKESGWRPISEAPKNGTEVWAFNGEQGRMHWTEGRIDDIDQWALWVWADPALAEIDPNPDQPTHFRPLPTAPTPEGEAK